MNSRHDICSGENRRIYNVLTKTGKSTKVNAWQTRSEIARLAMSVALRNSHGEGEFNASVSLQTRFIAHIHT